MDGFNGAIGTNGIISPQKGHGSIPQEKLPMRERLIILCKLGQGASSVVYKALDLKQMKLVALKMIHVYER